ncbi:NtaA/DmoA family FMN-dependent monooxygenase [Streptomyces corynorhini]|uniref:LLM class flavin-dependent oxidoreductase n=1 Tax=Streptomyces corynorhini TaxID=2282652 RepID=A0A370AWN1_9ACTN|nr:NtaA/DmoA family FMN-dependent monooxygenase [Streptomyces corynorhini]RDG31876.1 LLM class flavin-dependent oxidoreductase [Streptomyces corynorhini]
MPERQLHLGYMHWLNGTHWGGWRHPDAPTARAFELEYATKALRITEDAKFDFFFLGDTLAGDIAAEQWITTHNTGRLEPFTLASQLALNSSKIGLVVTAHPTFYEPYILARLTASLDHLSGGRLAWNVVLGASDLAARNFSLPDLGGAARYERADEFIHVVQRLWDSIEEGAYLQDKKTGHYVDETKIHRLDWQGTHFQVAGTLPLERPPQGHVPLLYAGASELSRELTAKWADINFTGPATPRESIAFNADVRQRAERLRGRVDPIFFLPGITPLIGDTRAEAVELYEELNTLLPYDDDIVEGDRDESYWSGPEGARIRASSFPLPKGARSVRSLTERVGVDLRALGIDGRVEPGTAQRFNGYGHRLLTALAERTGRTPDNGGVRVRDLLGAAIAGNFPLVIGTAGQVADTLIDWFDQGAAEGFNVSTPFLWEQLERFTGEVVPILQERGVYRTEYTADTFRGHFGLDIPPNSFTTADRQEERSA